MSILLPDSKPLLLRPTQWPTPNGSRSKEPPRISFTGPLPISWSSSSPASSAEPERTLTPAQVSKAKLSPVDCAEVLSGGWYKRAAHLELLNQALLYLEQRKAPAWFLRKLSHPVAPDVADDDLLPFTRLMVFMPPQHSKSETISHFFPIWWMGRHPEDRIGLASYGQSWAEHWGREVRDTMREYGADLWGLKVRDDTSSVSYWRLQGHRGAMTSVGIGAGLTGRGLDVEIIDDPVKDAEEARSEAIQARNYDWHQSVARTRLSVTAVEILMMTRWDESDLAGKILEAEAHGWVVLRLPALAEVADPLDREEGEALWPEMGKDKAWLEEVRYGPVNPLTGKREGGITEQWFAAMYQQRPSPESGLLFMRGAWQRYDSLPEGALHGSYPGGIFVDLAFTTENYSDYTVLAPIVRIVRDLYWLDLRRGRWLAEQVVQQCIDAYDEFRLPLVVEETTSSRSIIQLLRSKGLPVILMPTQGIHKTTRNEVASPFQAAGQFFLPWAGWTKQFIEEHAQFPNGAHDDSVDTTGMAAKRLLVERSAERKTLRVQFGARR